MNLKQSDYLKKGYGTFPYIIIRIASGLYKQIPIHFYEEELTFKDGILVSLNTGASIKEIENKCIQTLVKICKKNFSSSISENLDSLFGDSKKTLTGCLVLEPSRGIYFSESEKIFEGDIPCGGTLLSIELETIEFNSENHYVLQ